MNQEVEKTKINEYSSPQEAADFLGVHVNTIKNWSRKKKIITYYNPINKWYMYKKSDLEKILGQIKTGKPK